MGFSDALVWMATRHRQTCAPKVPPEKQSARRTHTASCMYPHVCVNDYMLPSTKAFGADKKYFARLVIYSLWQHRPLISNIPTLL